MLRNITDGLKLDAAEYTATYEGGRTKLKPVKNPVDAIRWMLERAEEGMG